MTTLGVDGCRGGWLGISHNSKSMDWQLATSLGALLSSTRASRIFIDIPIGLSTTGHRECDTAARRKLGRGFSSSVFTPPARASLGAQNYPDANTLNRTHSGKGLSKQSYYLFPKIREADEWLQASVGSPLQVREAHPEVAFMAINGAPLQHKKKTVAGFNERLELLARLDVEVAQLADNILATTRRREIAADDVLDACCLALMPLAGRLRTLPAQPTRDACGLAMEICYFD